MSKHDDAEKWYTSEEPFSWVESIKREHIDFLLEQSRKLEEVREWTTLPCTGRTVYDAGWRVACEDVKDILSGKPDIDEQPDWDEFRDKKELDVTWRQEIDRDILWLRDRIKSIATAACITNCEVADHEPRIGELEKRR